VQNRENTYGSVLAPPAAVVRDTIILLGVLGLAGAGWRLTAGGTEQDDRSRPGVSVAAADARQKELLHENLDRPTDPQLGKRYAEINARHFGGALASMPVIWEPRLSEVGTLAGRAFTLLGVFGQSRDRSIILLHPSLKEDAAALDRALSHEMIHAYLFSLGDKSTNHGPAFQDVLHRLSNEGAFVSVAATPEERARLRAWLDAESARLDAEWKELEAGGAELQREHSVVAASIESANARAAAATAAGRGWPTETELETVKTQRDAYNERAATQNRRMTEFRIAQDAFNAEVTRYNLMVTYPDGLDEQPVLTHKAR
jgi:hypothetical protein